MTLALAMTCAVAVGNIYFPQAIIPPVADGLHARVSLLRMSVLPNNQIPRLGPAERIDSRGRPRRPAGEPDAATAYVRPAR
ncbi:hypothetical protein AB0M87_28100 [Streptomyces sp. NPDC051320]|uniref:hypothetical protein n=1 Tax=Streptomyces sp. NPDC051320 TaxID=3154644 RepID=UPI00344028B8